VETTIDEIAPDIFRLSTHIPDVGPTGMSFNQFLVRDEQPFLFHTGMRGLHPLVAGAVERVVPIADLRWISFGHVEADECGSMNQWLVASPAAQVAFGALGCEVSLNDMADRPPRPMLDDEVLDTGGHRIRFIATPHVPHGWEAQIIFDETTSTLFCGDLFGQTGDPPALVHDADIVTPALAAEDIFHASCLTATTAPTIRALGELAPRTLALMHGPSYAGDCTAALGALADGYANLVAASLEAVVVQ
jgi:flavorubredoxin